MIRLYLSLLFITAFSNSFSQCDFYEEIVVSTNSYFSAYTQEYAVVDNRTGEIRHINSTGNFSSVVPGQYLVYAINYTGTRPVEVSIGNVWTDVIGYAGANCLDILGPYNNGAVNVCKQVCSGDPFSATASGFYTAGSYAENYALVPYPTSGNSILQSNTTGSYTVADYSVNGIYAVYAVNTEDAVVEANLAAGTLWSTSTGVVDANCANLIGPYLIEVGTATCILSAMDIELSGNIQANYNYLEWNELPDESIKIYELQRSADNVNFEILDQSKQTSFKDYDYTPESYYRIKAIFQNDERKHSNLIKLNREQQFTVSSVYPNPTTGNVNVLLGNDVGGTVHINVINSLGQKLQHSSFLLEEGANQLVLDVGDLPASYYFLEIQKDNEIITEGIFKL